MNEIDSEGKVVKLTDMSIQVEAAKADGDDGNNAKAKEKLKSVIGGENFDKIVKMVEENLAAANEKDEDEGSEKLKVIIGCTCLSLAS